MSAKAISIRPARPADAEGIAKVQHDCWLATYPNEKAGITVGVIEQRVRGYQSPERVTKWRDIIANKEKVTVALADTRVIGFSCAKPADDINHMAAIYVLPEYQGSGVAQKLMRAALAWLDNNRDTLVEVVAYNYRAIRFYEKYGFAVTGQAGEHDLLPTILMCRSGKSAEI